MARCPRRPYHGRPGSAGIVDRYESGIARTLRGQRLKLLTLFLASLYVFAQEVQPTVRVEVTAGNAPVPAAAVQFNAQTMQTGQDGIATAPVSLGSLKITVSKEGFFPANTSIEINEAKAWLVRIELQAQERVEEQITVHATRTDARIQDSPLACRGAPA